MKQTLIMAGCAAAIMLMSGCAAVNPLEVKQTARDLQARQDVLIRPLPDARYKIAILSRAIKHQSDPCNDAYLANEMESSLTTNLSNLGWFETVDRKNGILLAGEAMLSGEQNAMDEENVPSAQLALVAQSSVTYIAKQGWKRTAYANKARGAEVITDFRLVDLATKEPLLVKKFCSIVDDTAKGGARAAITEAVAQNAKKFARVVSARLLPEGKVLQTRGDGKYAQVSIGRNYQLEPAVKKWAWWPYKMLPLCLVKETVIPATEVDFVTLTQDEQSGRYDAMTFAKGTVLSADQRYAWIEVENPDTASVMKNDQVKVAEPAGEPNSAL